MIEEWKLETLEFFPGAPCNRPSTPEIKIVVEKGGKVIQARGQVMHVIMKIVDAVRATDGEDKTTIPPCSSVRIETDQPAASYMGINIVPNLPELSTRVLGVMLARNWPFDWKARSSVLFLEVAELTESIRGKGGDPVEEAADVLIALMSMVKANGIEMQSVACAADKKLSFLEKAGLYPGEERGYE